MFAVKIEPQPKLDGSKIDWTKVIENLREQSNYYAKRANEEQQYPARQQLVKEMRASANIASSLASALAAGLSPIETYPSPSSPATQPQ